eukprot:8949138-Pyramimonas_sp.AAC.2
MEQERNEYDPVSWGSPYVPPSERAAKEKREPEPTPARNASNLTSFTRTRADSARTLQTTEEESQGPSKVQRLQTPHRTALPSTEFPLASARRAAKREEFDKMMSEKQAAAEMGLAETKKKLEMEEDQAVKDLRKSMVHKARPMPAKTKPFEVRKSMVPPTMPMSPAFATRARTKPRCIELRLLRSGRSEPFDRLYSWFTVLVGRQQVTREDHEEGWFPSRSTKKRWRRTMRVTEYPRSRSDNTKETNSLVSLNERAESLMVSVAAYGPYVPRCLRVNTTPAAIRKLTCHDDAYPHCSEDKSTRVHTANWAAQYLTKTGRQLWKWQHTRVP